MVDRYIEEYKKGFVFTREEDRESTFEVLGVHIRVEPSIFFDGRQRREKADVFLEKGEHQRQFECVDLSSGRGLFHGLTLWGKDYLFFKRTLYGFILLNAKTLQTEYEYFPQKVLEGEESFIITEALSFGDLLIFAGCYWAAPYEYFVCDPKSMRFFALSKKYGIESAGNGTMKVQGDTLLLTGESIHNEEQEILVSLTLKELTAHLQNEGLSEF